MAARPLARTLESFALEGGRWVLLKVHHGDARACVEPFEAIELELVALWEGAEEAPEEGAPAGTGEPAKAKRKDPRSPSKDPRSAKKRPRKGGTQT